MRLHTLALASAVLVALLTFVAAAPSAPTAPIEAPAELEAPPNSPRTAPIPAPTAGPVDAASPASPHPAHLDADLRPLRKSAGGIAWSAERASFRLSVAGEPVHHRVMALVALPGSNVEVSLPDGADGFGFTHQAGAAETLAEGWRWTAPDEPGVYAARIESPAGDAVDVNFLVAYPAAEIRGGALKGYRIGSYVKKPLRGLAAYRPPEGFVEVARADHDILVSPHFTLGQFLCKQPGEPRFVSYSAPLVRKLEAVLEAVNEAGVDAPTLHVMSGFRTPAYNKAIGNNTVYSRHLWGDAADVFVDVDGDGDMDDLNGDGRSNIADARWLAALVEGVEAEGGEGIEPGGMGLYRRNSVRGPFVHVDARGYRARW